jgi:hypothetical protein
VSFAGVSAEYLADRSFFTIVAVLPLLIAIVALIVRRPWAERVLPRTRTWLEAHGRVMAAGIVVLLAALLTVDVPADPGPRVAKGLVGSGPREA